MLLENYNLILAVLSGTIVATALLYIWIRQNSTNAIAARALMREAEGSITFLFDEETLADATPRARQLLDKTDKGRSDWENFIQLLSARFPHLRSQVSDLATVGRKSIRPHDDQPGWIEAEFWNGMARLTLIQDQAHPELTIDPLTANAMEHELETLRCIGEDSPQLIWKRDAEGVLVWANRSYIELSEVLEPVEEGAVRHWPPREVFDDVPRPAGSAPVIDMHQIQLPSQDDPVWYEVTSLKRGTDSIHFAVDSSAVVGAREAQRNFVQTLTKTFAQLSVGLAIFDAKRRLVLFNPAIVDLTHLPPDFLIGRPTLLAFLDRLRDNQMMPEPKDYKSWRDQMSDLEAAAENGSYHETWLLPNGQTYRVTGRPHPNGAIAFLIEDISDEISLTQKYRSQINIGSAVLDNLPSAIAVFSSSGSLIMANAAYTALWGSNPEEQLSANDFTDEFENWCSLTAPSAMWVKLEQIVKRQTNSTSWSGMITLNNGRELSCQYDPLPEGNHQMTFSTADGNIDSLGLDTELRVSG